MIHLRQRPDLPHVLRVDGCFDHFDGVEDSIEFVSMKAHLKERNKLAEDDASKGATAQSLLHMEVFIQMTELDEVREV